MSRLRLIQREVSMSLTQMIQAAKDSHNAHNDIFICGKHQRGSTMDRISVDITPDHVEPTKIHLSYDIDSIIYISRGLNHIRGPMQLQLVRRKDNKELPPISRANHMQISLYGPPASSDKPRRHWQVEKVPLHHLPHFQFGTLGKINLYVVFPRMKHKYPQSKFHETKLPSYMQNLWLNLVVIPAMIRVTSTTSTPYYDHSLEDFQAKARKNATTNWTSQLTLPIDGDKLASLVASMESIIRGAQFLSSFGSFFFVTEGKGVKLLTQCSLDEAGGDGPWKRLQEQFQDFDFPYMASRENGELVVDVGITFQPEFPTPVVGLWTLDLLSEIYTASAFRQAEPFGAAGLASHGSLKGLATEKNSNASHQLSKMSYTLLLEIYRTIFQDKVPWVSDKETYQAGDALRKLVSHYTERFNSSNKKTLGLRDETRMGYQAYRAMRGQFAQKVSRSSIKERPRN